MSAGLSENCWYDTACSKNASGEAIGGAGEEVRKVWLTKAGLFPLAPPPGKVSRELTHRSCGGSVPLVGAQTWEGRGQERGKQSPCASEGAGAG